MTITCSVVCSQFLHSNIMDPSFGGVCGWCVVWRTRHLAGGSLSSHPSCHFLGQNKIPMHGQMLALSLLEDRGQMYTGSQLQRILLCSPMATDLSGKTQPKKWQALLCHISPPTEKQCVPPFLVCSAQQTLIIHSGACSFSSIKLQKF